MTAAHSVVPVEAFDWCDVARLLRQDGQAADVFVRWHEEHAQGRRTILVAREHGEVRGFVGVLQPGDAPAQPAVEGLANLDGWYVGVAHRGRGVGSALLEAAETCARQRGAHAAGVRVEDRPCDALLRLLACRGYRNLLVVSDGSVAAPVLVKPLATNAVGKWRLAA